MKMEINARGLAERWNDQRTLISSFDQQQRINTIYRRVARIRAIPFVLHVRELCYAHAWRLGNQTQSRTWSIRCVGFDFLRCKFLYCIKSLPFIQKIVGLFRYLNIQNKMKLMKLCSKTFYAYATFFKTISKHTAMSQNRLGSHFLGTSSPDSKKSRIISVVKYVK